jgi:hypothetical protein
MKVSEGTGKEPAKTAILKPLESAAVDLVGIF